MESYREALDSLSKKAEGPYRLSTILMKRVRQLVKGSLKEFGSRSADPLREAFEEFSQDRLLVKGGEEGLKLKE